MTLQLININEYRLSNSKGELIAFILHRNNHIYFCVGKWVKSARDKSAAIKIYAEFTEHLKNIKVT